MRKPLSLNRPGIPPTSNQTKGATAEVSRAKAKASPCWEMMAWKKKTNEVEEEGRALRSPDNAEKNTDGSQGVRFHQLWLCNCSTLTFPALCQILKKHRKFIEGCGKSPNCNRKPRAEICGLQWLRRIFHKKLKAVYLLLRVSPSEAHFCRRAGWFKCLSQDVSGAGCRAQPWSSPSSPLRSSHNLDSSQPGISKGSSARAFPLLVHGPWDHIMSTLNMHECQRGECSSGLIVHGHRQREREGGRGRAEPWRVGVWEPRSLWIHSKVGPDI